MPCPTWSTKAPPPTSHGLCALALLASALLAPLAAAAPFHSGRPHDEMAAQVLPTSGHQSRIAIGQSVVALARTGVIDRDKFAALYGPRGGLPAEIADLLVRGSTKPIVITRENAAIYVTLLWPIGLANRMAANQTSPLNGELRHRFASTGGWTLGREPQGGTYFNSLSIVPLNRAQETLVVRIAQRSFRPCCDNSTFFQDCNHGSALLGLLMLGAAQGFDEADLYREALAFSAFWFPGNYLYAAHFFHAVKGLEWRNLDPAVVMSAAFSSAGGWRANVLRPLESRGLLPQALDADCSA